MATKPDAKRVQAQHQGKGHKGKKLNLKFTIDCTYPIEDGIMNAADFVSPQRFLLWITII